MKNKDKRPFSKDILIINDIEAVYNKIINDLQNSVFQRLNRMGGVIAYPGV